MTERVVAIQRNPRSGSGSRSKVLLQLIQHLKHHGFTPRLFSRRERLDAWMAKAGNRARLMCLVAAGGDGTVDDLVNRFPGVTLTVLPLGTENLLARELKLQRSGRFLADVIAAGHQRNLDVGTMNGRRFVLMAGVGFDAEVVHQLDAARTGHIRRSTYLRFMWRVFRSHRFRELQVTLDDDREPLPATFLMVVNLPGYAMRLPFAAEANGSDGWLDVRIFRPASRWQLVRGLLQVRLRRHERSADVICKQARKIHVTAAEPVPVQVDGDPAGTTPADISLEPSALTVLVPASQT